MVSVCGGASEANDLEKPYSIESLCECIQLKWQVISPLHDIDDDDTLLQYQNGYIFFFVILFMLS